MTKPYKNGSENQGRSQQKAPPDFCFVRFLLKNGKRLLAPVIALLKARHPWSLSYLSMFLADAGDRKAPANVYQNGHFAA